MTRKEFGRVIKSFDKVREATPAILVGSGITVLWAGRRQEFLYSTSSRVLQMIALLTSNNYNVESEF